MFIVQLNFTYYRKFQKVRQHRRHRVIGQSCPRSMPTSNLLILTLGSRETSIPLMRASAEREQKREIFIMLPAGYPQSLPTMGGTPSADGFSSQKKIDVPFFRPQFFPMSMHPKRFLLVVLFKLIFAFEPRRPSGCERDGLCAVT